MTFLYVKNRAVSTLASAITSTATSLTLSSGGGAKFPTSTPFHITIDDEILRVTAIAGDTFTVSRGQEGTTATAHPDGAAVELRITAGVLDGRTTWTSGKLLEGSGAGIPPTEVSFYDKLLKAVWENTFYFPLFTITTTGSGYVYKQEYGNLWLATGTTANSTIRSRGVRFGWFFYDTWNFFLRAQVCLRAKSTNGKCYLKIDIDTTGDPTAQAIGFRIDNGAIKGIVHNGTTLTVVDLGVTLAAGGWAVLELIFTRGSKIEWFVDYVKRGESTAIPTTIYEAETSLIISAINGVDAANNAIQIYPSLQWRRW